MRIVLIQLVLIAAVTYVMFQLLRTRGDRIQALRRLGLLAFAALSILSILFPSTWNALAHLVGVGRGTDMVLYALVVAFLSFTITSYLRFRDLETRYTKLARRIALDEARPPVARTRSSENPQADDPAAQ